MKGPTCLAAPMGARLLVLLLAAALPGGCKRDRTAGGGGGAGDDPVKRALSDNDIRGVSELLPSGNGAWRFTGENGSGERCGGTVTPNPDAASPIRLLVDYHCELLRARGAEWVAGERKRCQGGEASACTHVGAWLMDADASPGAETEARALLGSACERGEAVACGRFGLLLFGGRGGKLDYAGARQAETRACELGASMRCDPAGMAWMTPQAGEPDPAKARALLARGCSDRVDVPGACFKLGTLLHRGEGGPPDDAAARRALARACKGGYQSACEPARDPALLDAPRAPGQ